MQKLMNVINKIKDEKLREKVMQLVKNPTFEIDGKVYAGLQLDRSPASMSRHHNYPGGFIEHVVAMAEISLTLCKIVGEVYRGMVNTDLVLCGVILHDIFKPLTYKESENGSYQTTLLAERLDHLTMITSELIRKGFPLHLIHIVCAHHEKFGPMSPKTLEALIVQIADVADSRLNGEVLRAARFLIKQITGEEIRTIPPRDAFEIVRIKAEEGLKGVKKYIAKCQLK